MYLCILFITLTKLISKLNPLFFLSLHSKKNNYLCLKFFEYFGIIFLFYSNEHKPIHIHAVYNEYESKIEFYFDKGKLKSLKFIEIKGKKPIPISK